MSVLLLMLRKNNNPFHTYADATIYFELITRLNHTSAFIIAAILIEVVMNAIDMNNNPSSSIICIMEIKYIA